MASSDFFIGVDAASYKRIRKAIMEMADTKWYRGIIRDTAYEVLASWTEYAISIVHRQTGLLASSITWDYQGQQGSVYIDPSVVARKSANTLMWPKLYGPIENARGGAHAFFDRTIDAKGSLALEVGMKIMESRIPEA